MLLLTAALVVPPFIDWSGYRADFEREASTILDRPVKVAGEVKARLLPFPSVTFSDVRVGADPDHPVMTVQTFSMDAELMPFLRGQLPNGKLVAFQANAEGYAAFQSGRVNAYGGSGMELTLAQAKLGMGKVVLPKPAIGYPSGTGIRFEPGGRFKSFLTTAISYLYFSGQIEAGYREFLEFRGIKGDNIIPIMRERW